MSGSVDVAATSVYLHRVMNRRLDGLDSPDDRSNDVRPPPGVGLTLRRDERSGRLLDGAIVFDPPMLATDAAALFERLVTLADGSLRVLLRAPTDHPWSRFGPTRVTLAFPTRPSTSAPVAEARIVFPDEFTSPTGQVIGRIDRPDRADPLDTWIDALTPVTDGETGRQGVVERIRQLAEQESADGAAELHAAYEALIAAVRDGSALEIHAAYAALIAPLRALGRDEIADRCVSAVSAAAPMCHEVAGMEWAASGTKEFVVYDVRGLIEPGSKLRIDVDGAKVVVDTMAMRPLRLSNLPAGTALELFESGTIEPAPGGDFVSRHGKPVIGAVVDGRLVVGSVWDFPSGRGVSVEAVVDWSD